MRKTSNSKERLQKMMDYYGINQTELCKRTGVQKSALSNYLNGDREPRQDQISLIVDPFNVNPAWFMGYDVPMFIEPAAPSGSAPAAMPSPAGLSLSAVEEEIILKFRAADEFDQETVLRTLRIKREDSRLSQVGVG